MNESSNESMAVLSRLHPDQITTLVDILHHAALPQLSFVESIYSERARNFRETLLFLVDIGWVCQNRNELQLTAKGISFHGQQTQKPRSYEAIIDALADTSSCYQAIFADYLAQFECVDCNLIFRPSLQNRLEQSSVRNFLMEIGMVYHRTDDDSYALHGQFAYLYFWAKNVNGAASKTELLRDLERKDKLGLSAEVAVFEYEKCQVGPNWLTHVVHVSAKNPGACYDIASVRVDEGRIVKRYIEVKAVPADTLQFYWTASEIEAALFLGRSYFLYLVPALGGNSIDLSRMEIIEDPYHSVYKNTAIWEKDENVIICRRIQYPKNS